MQLDPEVDDVLLFTLAHILGFANEFVERETEGVDDKWSIVLWQ